MAETQTEEAAPANLKILVVEDNLVDARLIQIMLGDERPGQFECEHVQVLSQAVDSLFRSSFDVILLDMQLPDSLELPTITTIRRAAPNIPLIALSGRDDEEL